ncbi:MAG: M24 family metallopeptidase [Anaerolineae bacterium]
MSDRLKRLRAIIAEQSLDAFLVTISENLRYISGFSGSEAVAVVTQDLAALVTDFRYFEQVKLEAPSFQLVEAGTPGVNAALAGLLAERGLKRVGFEADGLTVAGLEAWKEAMPEVSFVSTRGVLLTLRAVKSADEIAVIERAVRIADAAMAHIYTWIRPGVTEREVAWELEAHMRIHGADHLSFSTIVGAGANGAMSHAVPSDRKIQEGEPIVIDMGALVDGYASDLTRSFCIGRAGEEYLTIWSKVLEAQLAAEAAIKPGMTGAEADAVARRIIYDAGYEGKFGHGLGHGVGLAIHESPRAGQTSQDVLQVGQIVTVEPGIYVPGWGGVRIEDMVVLTETGCRVLTGVAKVPVAQGRAS